MHNLVLQSEVVRVKPHGDVFHLGVLIQTIFSIFLFHYIENKQNDRCNVW